MKNRSLRVLSMAIAAAALLAFEPTGALAHGKKMKMGPQLLMKQQLSGLAGQEAQVVRFRVPPGWSPPSHVHPGHFFVYMLKGTVTLKLSDGTEKRLGPGDVAYEKAGMTMIAGSARSEKGAEFLVFQVGATGEPLMKMLKK